MKIHKFELGPDCRSQGQTPHEFRHTSACGFVRNNVTNKNEDVTCFYCLRQISKGSK